MVDKTLEVIKSKYGKHFDTVKIEKFVAGIYFTAVKLTSGYCGLAYSNINALDCCTDNRKKGFADFTPGNFKGQKVVDLINSTDQSALMTTLRLAALNALSAELMADSKYRIIENMDPIELVDLTGRKQVCLVGAFLSYIKKISQSNSVLKIVELNENAVPEEYRQYYVPAELSNDTIANSDIVIITGSSLANNTLGHLLEIISAKTQVILVGPTSSLLPDVLFAHGVDIIGATRITDNDKMLEMVAEGASGFHLFKSCASKICIVNES